MLTRSRWWRPAWSVILVAWLVVALLESVWPVPGAVIAVLTLVTVILLGLALTAGWSRFRS